jgi:RNA polymerase sigma-70 factor (ECF subfamily)
MPASRHNKFIHGFRQGKEDSFSAIHKELYSPLCSFCYGIIKNSQEAEDIVSDVFLHIFRKSSEIPVRSLDHLRSYFFMSVRNRSIDYLRIQKMQRTTYGDLNALTEDLIEDESLNDRLDTEYIESLRNVKIREAVYSLPQKSVLVLRKIYFENKSYSDIAEELSISVNTVTGLRRQGINILYKVFNLKDFFMQTAIFILVAMNVFQ